MIDKPNAKESINNFFKKILTWNGAITLVILVIIIIRSVVEWYFVNVNWAGVSHQSGWHFMGMITQTIVVIPASLVISLIAGYFSKMSRIKIFLTTSFIFLVLMEILMMIGTMQS
tara:strand:- start:835 stop:1179 length:345 start_codon:yes stop_codon:yes gene_type:complete